MTLTEFLLARIAEDEAKANECIPFLPEARFIDVTLTRWDKETDESWTKHVRPYDPRVALRECEAKRRIVEADAEADRIAGGMSGGSFTYEAGRSAGFEAAVRILASVYSDHPDYREEWRP